jgi:hypothetical protein
VSRDDQFRFVSLLGLELENGDITLPSLPGIVTKLLIDSNDAEALEIDAHPSCARLGIDEDIAAELLVAYRDKLKSMQQSLSWSAFSRISVLDSVGDFPHVFGAGQLGNNLSTLGERSLIAGIPPA